MTTTHVDPKTGESVQSSVRSECPICGNQFGSDPEGIALAHKCESLGTPSDLRKVGSTVKISDAWNEIQEVIIAGAHVAGHRAEYALEPYVEIDSRWTVGGENPYDDEVRFAVEADFLKE